MASADKNGIEGLARCFPSKVKGGARNADDVIAQTTISAMNQPCADGPVPATNGSAKNAAQDSAVSPPTNTPSRPTNGAILSAAMPIAVSVTVKIAWSIISTRITVDGARPTLAASCGK